MRDDDLKHISKYLLFPIAVFVVHVLLLFGTGIYELYPWLDIPMHILGGFSFGFFFLFSIKHLERKNYFYLNRLARFLFVVSLVALIAVFWEFFEFALEYFSEFDFQGTLNDTMLDFAMGILGSAIAFLLFKN